jgi:hypothetical protein
MLPDLRFIIGATLATALLAMTGIGLFAAARLAHHAKVGPLESSRSLAFADPSERKPFHDPDVPHPLEALAPKVKTAGAVANAAIVPPAAPPQPALAAQVEQPATPDQSGPAAPVPEPAVSNLPPAESDLSPAVTVATDSEPVEQLVAGDSDRANSAATLDETDRPPLQPQMSAEATMDDDLSPAVSAFPLARGEADRAAVAVAAAPTTPSQPVDAELPDLTPVFAASDRAAPADEKPSASEAAQVTGQNNDPAETGSVVLKEPQGPALAARTAVPPQAAPVHDQSEPQRPAATAPAALPDAAANAPAQSQAAPAAKRATAPIKARDDEEDERSRAAPRRPAAAQPRQPRQHYVQPLTGFEWAGYYAKPQPVESYAPAYVEPYRGQPQYASPPQSRAQTYRDPYVNNQWRPWSQFGR